MEWKRSCWCPFCHRFMSKSRNAKLPRSSMWLVRRKLTSLSMFVDEETVGAQVLDLHNIFRTGGRVDQIYANPCIFQYPAIFFPWWGYIVYPFMAVSLASGCGANRHQQNDTHASSSYSVALEYCVCSHLLPGGCIERCVIRLIGRRNSINTT